MKGKKEKDRQDQRVHANENREELTVPITRKEEKEKREKRHDSSLASKVNDRYVDCTVCPLFSISQDRIM
jgi:hypothetical protein